jgi:hypothetical protein
MASAGVTVAYRGIGPSRVINIVILPLSGTKFIKGFFDDSHTKY